MLWERVRQASPLAADPHHGWVRAGQLPHGSAPLPGPGPGPGPVEAAGL